MQKILIVEDQPDVQNLLKVALARPDRKLLHAEDAMAGLRLAIEERPDLVLLDMMMPGEMDGLDLLMALKANPLTAGSKVIVISAKAQLRDQESALLEGADAYVTKPFRLAYLKETIDRLLLSTGC